MVTPAVNFFDAAIPVRPPSSRLISVMPTMSAGLSLVPSVSIAHLSTEPGEFSMTTSPTRMISDGILFEIPDKSSPTPSATPAARTPDVAAATPETGIAIDGASALISSIAALVAGSCTSVWSVMSSPRATSIAVEHSARSAEPRNKWLSRKEAKVLSCRLGGRILTV